VRTIALVPPQSAGFTELNKYHTKDYLDFILDPENVVNGTDETKAEFGLKDVSRTTSDRRSFQAKRHFKTRIAHPSKACQIMFALSVAHLSQQ
jgi:hypothetical protein